MLGERDDFRLVLACGIFGNVSPADIRATILGISVVLEQGGSTIWTRHRGEPDLTPSIRGWLLQAGFAETAFEPVAQSLASVGCHRLVSKDSNRQIPPRLFEFVGDGAGGLL